MPSVTFYSPSPNLPAFSACRLNSLRFPQMGVFNVYPTISRLEVKPIMSSNNIMNSQRSGRILPNKKDTVLGVSFYSAIQLPAAISIWESSGFHSSVGCGSRRQYFVFAPHQARPQTRLSLLWKSSGFLNHMDSQPGTTRLCCAAKYFGADGVTTTDCRYCRQFHCS